MRQQVMKSLANPARIFFVPYSLAVMNFTILFVVFVVGMVTEILLTGNVVFFSPLYFLIALVAIHMILASFANNEPQLAQIISARLKLFRKHIPDNLEP
ncbi:MAG: VirB3 family type IV secretion system protein [Rickettsiales bacterium]|nr:VirB3 family type IV secretion system protein [Rickettsiales bacterium]